MLWKVRTGDIATTAVTTGEDDAVKRGRRMVEESIDTQFPLSRFVIDNAETWSDNKRRTRTARQADKQTQTQRQLQRRTDGSFGCIMSH